MKKSVFTAIFAITAIALLSLGTPCRAQVDISQIEKKIAEVMFVMEEEKEVGFILFFHNFSKNFKNLDRFRPWNASI